MINTGHTVLFYRRERELGDAVFAHLSPAIERALRIVVVATRTHERAITERLRAADFEPQILRDAKLLVLVNAEELLESFSKGGGFDEARFTEQVGEHMRPASISYAYGEMVNLLCERGRYDDALELERMWNRLADVHSFSLLCGYHSGALENRLPAGFVACACREHKRVKSLSHEAEAALIQRLLHAQFGEDEAGAMWQRMAASDAAIPPAFAAMNWLRENMPELAENLATKAKGSERFPSRV